VRAPTEAIWFVGREVRSTLFGVKIRWPIPLFCLILPPPSSAFSMGRLIDWLTDWMTDYNVMVISGELRRPKWGDKEGYFLDSVIFCEQISPKVTDFNELSRSGCTQPSEGLVRFWCLRFELFLTYGALQMLTTYLLTFGVDQNWSVDCGSQSTILYH